MMQRANVSILEAPSILGLSPSGVEQLPTALRQAGFYERLDAKYEGCVTPPAFNPQRDAATGLLNPSAIAHYSRSLATAVQSILQTNRFPIVLGGDCSILLGNLLALRRMGRYGLFFLDGHADFYQPEAEASGEVASMDLAIATGYGADILTNIDGLKPLVREEDVVLSLPKINTTLPSTMPDSPTDPVLPIVIVPIEGGKKEESRRSEPPDLRHWQIEEFLRQTGKAENIQRTYRGQLARFASWCDKSWLDVAPSDIDKYHRQLKLKGLKATSINHLLKTLRLFYG